MNTDKDAILMKALRASAVDDLLRLPCFHGFASEDEILAAFMDGRLDTEQQRAVKQALASRNSLRQQWQSLHEAVPAVQQQGICRGGKQRFGTLRQWGGIAMVASVALVAVVFYRTEPLPPESAQPSVAMDVMSEPAPAPQAKKQMPMQAREMTESRLEAPALAARAQVELDWQAWLQAYQGEASDSAFADTVATRFQQLALAARDVERSDCADDAVARLKERFNASREDFPRELIPLTPDNAADWCALPATLKQNAELAVTPDNNP